MKCSLIPATIASIALAVSACSTSPYRFEPLANTAVTQRAVAQEQGAFRIRASVPGEEEAEKLLGIPIYDRGIQPIWLEVTNNSDYRARLVLSSIDREYFAPFEVAYMHKKHVSRQGLEDMEKYLFANALPRQIAAHQTVSGFVFTNAGTGTKAFNVDLVSTGPEPGYEQFTFFLEVPGFVPDHASVDFKTLYAMEDIQEVDKDGLRILLQDLPCCTRNQDGSQQGRPIQLFFVAKGRDMLQALLRSGWSETSYSRDADYLENADYLFGRPPDTIIRKARDKAADRAELNLWLAPVLVEGTPLWVGHFKHAIGRRYALGELFLGVTLDPDTVDGRNYMLQDLWYGQSVEHWAWSHSGLEVPSDAPVLDFHGNPWFSRDAYRSVIWISGKPVAMSKATAVLWVRVQRDAGDTP